jgi:ArsR family transcriptional regulator, lead/cadmium/zinc/bismuth-responsive transcriptional repressor
MDIEDKACIRLLANQVQIKACRQKLKKHETVFHGLAQVLALAGNEVRLKILYLLDQEKELCPCDLSDILQMTVPAVSQHLRKLKDANLIQFRKVGQTIFYSLKEEHSSIINPLFKHIPNQKIGLGA